MARELRKADLHVSSYYWSAVLIFSYYIHWNCVYDYFVNRYLDRVPKGEFIGLFSSYYEIESVIKHCFEYYEFMRHYSYLYEIQFYRTYAFCRGYCSWCAWTRCFE